MAPAGLASQLAIDVNGLSQARLQAKEDPRAAMKEAARQFEAIFLQMVLKAMREATPKEGLFDSEQTRLYESLLDQQLAQTLPAGGGSGLAALIEQQLARGLPQPAPDTERVTALPPQARSEAPAAVPPRFERAAAAAAPRSASPPWPATAKEAAVQPAAPTALPPADAAEVPAPARAFVNRLWPHADEASRATGIPAHFLIAHAALETGWGRAEPRFADGAPTHNLFGIKAGRNWQGAVVEALTTEYVNGVAQKTVERFRAYSSYAEAFRDYAGLLASSPRYAAVINQKDAAGFARGLQRAGYATDPMYAAKLERIIGGPTLRAGLLG